MAGPLSHTSRMRSEPPSDRKQPFTPLLPAPRRGNPWSLFHKSSLMIYAKHAKTIFDDSPGESMEYGPKIRHSCASRNPEGPTFGEIRLMKHAACGRPLHPPVSSRMRKPILSPVGAVREPPAATQKSFPASHPPLVLANAGTHPLFSPPPVGATLVVDRSFRVLSRMRKPTLHP